MAGTDRARWEGLCGINTLLTNDGDGDEDDDSGDSSVHYVHNKCGNNFIYTRKNVMKNFKE